jgi:endonuclease/exonuclease/phosphatase family metal-dependent hydrolase
MTIFVLSKNSTKMASSISILSMNCFLIPVKPMFPLFDFHVKARAKRIIDFLKGYPGCFDVILLQEVWRPHPNITCLSWLFGRHAIENFLRLSGYQIVESPLSEYALLDSGLIIASRHEVLKTGFHRFTKTSYSEDALAGKGVLCALLSINGKFLLVANTHLDAQRSVHQIKLHQLNEAVRFIVNFRETCNNVVDGGLINIVFGGDLNLDLFDSLVKKDLETLLLRPLDLKFSEFIDAAATSDDHDGCTPGKLDHLLLGKKITVKSFEILPPVYWAADPVKVARLIELRKAWKSSEETVKGFLAGLVWIFTRIFAWLKMKIIRNQIDSDRRKIRMTDHAGLIAKFYL